MERSLYGGADKHLWNSKILEVCKYFSAFYFLNLKPE